MTPIEQRDWEFERREEMIAKIIKELDGWDNGMIYDLAVELYENKLRELPYLALATLKDVATGVLNEN